MLSLNCKNVQHVKIYLPCKFEVNSIIYFGVITLFYQIFKTIFRSLNVYEIEVILRSPLTEDFFEEKNPPKRDVIL